MTLIEKEAIITALRAVSKLQWLVQRLAIHQEPSNEEWDEAAREVGSLIAISNQINKEMTKEVNSAN